MADNISELVGEWMDFASGKGIRVTSSKNGEKGTIRDGRPPEDTDLVEFLKAKGFDDAVVKQVVANIPEAPQEKEPTVTRSDGVHPEDDIDFDDPKNSRPEPEPEPEPESSADDLDIPNGTTLNGSDGVMYRRIGKRWADSKEMRPASPEIAQELNDQWSEKNPPVADEPQADEPQADEPQADADAGDVKGVSKDELDDIGDKMANPKEDERKAKQKKRQVEKLKTIISGLSKDERKFFMELLKQRK